MSLVIKLNDSGQPEGKDPHTEENFRQLNPQKSFPTNLSVPSLTGSGYGLYRRTTPQNPSDKYKKVVEQLPTLNSDGIWYQSWVEEDMTSDEQAATLEEQTGKARCLRDVDLQLSDWTQSVDKAGLSDSKIAEWATYRQALRDLPTASGWPWTHTTPTKPSK